MNEASERKKAEVLRTVDVWDNGSSDPQARARGYIKQDCQPLLLTIWTGPWRSTIDEAMADLVGLPEYHELGNYD